jgi:hypothetical protein
VCVAWTSLYRTIPPRIVMGDTTEIAEALRGETVAPTFISMALVLHCLRGNAANAGIALPEKLTVDPNDKPAYANWRRQIEDYQQAAGVRLAKLAKPLTPA